MTFVRRSHLWLGLITAVAVIAVSITGILLNHPEGFGLVGEVPATPAGSLETALGPLDLADAAVAGADEAGLSLPFPEINRVVYRPGDNQATVRFNDPQVTEVVVEANTGTVVAIAPRTEVTVDDLHSGAIIGNRGVILSDLAGVALVVLVIGGIALWIRRLQPRWRAADTERSPSAWMLFNRRFHLIGGLVVAVTTVVISVTGIMLNHKRGLELMVEPVRKFDAEEVADSAPQSLAQIAEWGIAARERSGLTSSSEIRSIDYRPFRGYAKVRFDDGLDTEVIVDVYDGDVLSSARRLDGLIEQLHSGAIFGDGWILLSDVTAGVLILLTVNGLYLWLAPAWRARTRAAGALATETAPREEERV